jgi:hypothetical protein
MRTATPPVDVAPAISWVVIVARQTGHMGSPVVFTYRDERGRDESTFAGRVAGTREPWMNPDQSGETILSERDAYFGGGSASIRSIARRAFAAGRSAVVLATLRRSV